MPARGEHHPAGDLGFAALPSDIRCKLWAVARIGGGDYAKGDWDAAMSAAENLPDEMVVGDLVEDIDLHDKLMKGLFAIGAAEG